MSMRLHAVVRYCLTPKSPDHALTRAMTSDYTRSWTVEYDPDGTFTRGNRLGTQDIYYGLINCSFAVGTRLYQYYDSRGKNANRTWTVQMRTDHHNQEIMDAYCYLKKGCNSRDGKTGLRIAWLRQMGLGRNDDN